MNTALVPAGVDADAAGKDQKSLKNLTNFIPTWIKIAVALALGLGTMVGWKRIVVTAGEKIGKAHLTYAQGACAELLAAATIATADSLGLPVSTTHILWCSTCSGFISHAPLALVGESCNFSAAAVFFA